MSLLCCAAFADGAELGERLRGPAPAEVPIRGAVCHFCRLVALSLQATETGEPRGQDGSGRRGPQRRGGRAPRPGSAELGEHLWGAGPG